MSMSRFSAFGASEANNDNGFVTITRNEGKYLYTPKGNFIGGPYKKIISEEDGNLLKLISLNEKVGMYIIVTNVIIPCIYDKISRYVKNLKVVKNGRVGIYNYYGDEVVPVTFSNVQAIDGRGKVFKVTSLNESKTEQEGYYIVKIKRFVEADAVDISKHGKIKILKNQAWKEI